MKTTYGIQIGNYLRIRSSGEIIRVNGITKKKIGFLRGNTKKEERYVYLPEVLGIQLTTEILQKYEDYLDEYRQVDEKFYIIPKDTGNLYIIQWFHELQNILGFHGQIINWVDE